MGTKNSVWLVYQAKAAGVYPEMMKTNAKMVSVTRRGEANWKRRFLGVSEKPVK